MKRLLAALCFVVLAGFAAAGCFPTPDTRTAVEKCEAGYAEAASVRPDVLIIGHRCDDFTLIEGAQWAGVCCPDGQVWVNTHGDWATQHQYGEIFAHEYGHAWHVYRLNSAQLSRFAQIMGTATFDNEQYAEVFRLLAFGGWFGGNVAVSDAQRNALCGEGLVPC